MKACFQSRHGFVIGKRIRARAAALFPGSSVVEQPAVNRLVAGSNPARGAKLNQWLMRNTATSEVRPNFSTGQRFGQHFVTPELAMTSGCHDSSA